jgi:chromosome segregation ATPase
MSINEINLFKNEIYLKIRELEKKFVGEITKKNSEIDRNFNIFNDKINIIMENNSKLIESITNEQLSLEKIKDLEKAIKSINENLTTNKVKLVNLTNDVDRMRFRYDKIISDNLVIPGYVGSGCSYRNIGDFVINSIIDIKKLKEEKEIIRREDKELKSKVELMLKNMNTMVEHNSIKIRDYINSKDRELDTLFEEKFKKYDEQEKESNQKIINSQKVLDEKIKQVGKDIGKELEKFNNYKKDLNSFIDNKFEEIEKIHDEMNNKIYLSSLDIKEVQKMKKELNDQIKNLNSKIDSILKSKSTKQPGGMLNNEYINSVRNTNNSNNNTSNNNETQNNNRKIKSIDAKTRNEYPKINKKSKH